MLNALIKKEFTEIFRGYFVNRKTGKIQTRVKTIFLFVLFAIIMFSLGAMFFGMAYATGMPLLKIGLSWLYFAIMGTVSMLLGIFGSVFNTYASLYKAKDNDLLFSMPIPPRTVLLSKMLSVIALSLLYGGIVWIPSFIVYFIWGNPSVLSIVFSILLTVMLTLLISAVTCILGWVVALIAGKIKNKSVISAVLTVLFIGLYYYVYFKFTSIINNIVKFSTVMGNGIKKYGNFLYQLGMAASGEVKNMILFSLISVVAFALCFLVLSKTFLKLSTKNEGEKKAVYKKTETKQNSIMMTLYKRELKRFVSVPIYMLNCGLGIVFLPVVSIVALIKRGSISGALNIISKDLPFVNNTIPLIIAVAVCMIISMDGINAPSVSLEGKTLWLIKSLPVTTKQIFDAKILHHTTLNLVPALISAAILCFCFKTDLFSALIIMLLIYAFLRFSAVFDLLIGILFANLNWTNETVPVKQSFSVFIAIFSGPVIMGLLCLGYYLLHKQIGLNDYLMIFFVILIVAEGLLKKVLYTKGAEKFNEL